LNNFFYGTTLIQKPAIRSYQSDAISGNTDLTKSHYESQHTYRIEWEPPSLSGEGGYVRWFIDGKFAFGITGEVLNLTRTQIPSEPMYLIMNTAISSSWGFPGCPDGCDCSCYECGKTGCTCGLPQGFCGNLPAHFLIDYVRVYQAKNSTKQVVGCSPPHRPTKKFIEAHKDRYKTSSDSEPLRPIQNGGASCNVASDCGGSEKGICHHGRCQCGSGYTGPACLAPDGFYDNLPPPKEIPCTLP